MEMVLQTAKCFQYHDENLGLETFWVTQISKFLPKYTLVMQAPINLVHAFHRRES
jgi:hypothetical protein